MIIHHRGKVALRMRVRRIRDIVPKPADLARLVCVEILIETGQHHRTSHKRARCATNELAGGPRWSLDDHRRGGTPSVDDTLGCALRAAPPDASHGAPPESTANIGLTISARK